MNKFLGMTAAACLGALTAQVATAGSPPGSWYLAPQVLGVWVDDDRVADDDMGFALSLGLVLGENWDGEITAFKSTHDAPANAELDLQGFALNLHRVFYRESPVTPYFKLGLGKLEGQVSGGPSRSELAANYGVGVLADLARRTEKGTNLQLRGELYGRSELDGSGPNDDKANDFVAGLGLQYSWGAPVPRAAETRAVGDEDSDGVTDDLDQCPGTVAGATVDAKGCELDSDADGVVDRLDKCPGTPAGTKVDAVGCELDSDADGVVDSKDRCPNTPAGEKVDAVGCSYSLRLEVYFDTDSAVIKPESYPELDRAAELMQLDPSIRGRIEGHTDSRGSDSHNMRLSLARAESVRQYAIKKGVSPNRITAVGKGETTPEADNATDEGRARNRRVLLIRTDGGAAATEQK